MSKRNLLNESIGQHRRAIVPWDVSPPAQDNNVGELMRVRSLLPNELFELSASEQRLGEAALGKVFELKQYSFGETTALLKRMRENNLRNATPEEAHRNLVIAHRTAGNIGRVACYERSLAAVLLGNTQKLSTTWVIGAAFDPPRFHAWPEVDGVPIITGADEPVSGVYQAWLHS